MTRSFSDSSVYVDVSDLLPDRETERAYAIVDSSGKLKWLPKSQCRIDDADRLWMPRWLAEDRKLEYSE